MNTASRMLLRQKWPPFASYKRNANVAVKKSKMQDVERAKSVSNVKPAEGEPQPTQTATPDGENEAPSSNSAGPPAQDA